MDDLTTQLTLRVTSTQALVHGPICRFPTRRGHWWLCRSGGGSPLGIMARGAAPPGAEFFLRQGPLPPPHFHGAARTARHSLGAADAAAHALANPHRHGARGQGRGTTVP